VQEEAWRQQASQMTMTTMTTTPFTNNNNNYESIDRDHASGHYHFESEKDLQPCATTMNQFVKIA